MPDAASVRIGPAEIALTRMPSGPEVRGEVADRRLERRLGDAHHVVVRRRPSRRRSRSASGSRAPRWRSGRAARGQRDERVGGDVEREREAVARRVDERRPRGPRASRRRGRGRGCRSRRRPRASGPTRARCRRRTGRRTARRTSLPIDSASGRTRRSIRLSTEEKPTVGALVVEAPWRCPRRSSGRSRPRRRAPCGPSSSPMSLLSADPHGSARRHPRHPIPSAHHARDAGRR